MPTAAGSRSLLWTLGAPDDLALREREAMFVWVRWAFVLVGALSAVADYGRSPVAAWGAVGLLAAVNVVAAVAPHALRSVRPLRAVAAAVYLTDFTVVTIALFNYADRVDTATPLLMILVVLEGAMRWNVAGGVAGGTAGGAVVVAWMAHREATFDVAFSLSTAGARVGAYVLTGALLGGLIRQLDRGGREVARNLRRSEAINTFVTEAPRISVAEAAQRLARVLHDDLGFERTAVLLVPDEGPGRLRLVATAGYEGVDVERYREFPVEMGVVGRCFRTGEAQFLPDAVDDPDYLEVDPTSRAEMSVPLRSRDGVIGVIDVASTRVAAFDDGDLRFLETVAAQVGRAVENARVAEIERATIRELEELAAMKDDFIAIANHELRTPVTTIAGFAQSLLRQRDVLTQEEMDDAIERIARQSAHLRGLIEDLLTVPGRERAVRDVAIGPVDVSTVAQDVARELAPDDGHHALEVDVPGDVPPVQADPNALRRVFVNLVGNAVKYSPDGGTVHVRARSENGQGEGPEGGQEEGQEEGMVLIEVVDQGMGIAEEHRPLLFTKFGRLPTSDYQRGGMGLGLFIVKALVEEMGGHVGVDSSVGEGSRFWFRLRATPMDEALPAGPEQSSDTPVS
jgi:signal transduction histidine kinase